ncbi:MAG: stage V sporulation protein AA [Lachnospiraceae bacterium]
MAILAIELMIAETKQDGKRQVGMAGEILYLKMKRNVEVVEKNVYLKDIASLLCKEEHIAAKAKAMPVYRFPKQIDKNNKRQVISVLKIIELLQDMDAAISVENLGETDTILELVKPKAHGDLLQGCKTAFIALICFFGTAFTVMAFHNDIGITQVFIKLHELVTGVPSNGYTVLEVTYSIGLAAGILLFFNHVGSKRITKDPTPIEVEMRIYEADVNTALVETAGREGKTIDVT